MGTALLKKFRPDEGFEGKKVLNLGCGFAKFTAKNVVNLDAYEVCKPDVVADMEKPLPFEDETFDMILANHVLEHVKNWWACFEECSRILKKGGMLIVYVPGGGNDSQLGYRDHVSMINLFSFYGIKTTSAGTNAWAETFKKMHANAMELVAIDRVYYDKPWIRRAPSFLRRWMGEHLRNVIDEDGYYFRKT